MSDEGVRQLIRSYFEPSHNSKKGERDLDERVSKNIEQFLASTEVGAAQPYESTVRRFTRSSIREVPGDIDAYLSHLEQAVIKDSVNTASPRYLGHMTTALPYFVRPLARLMVALNQNVVKVETAKSMTPYEREALAMLHREFFRRSAEFYAEHLQHSESSLGMITSGGTLANTTAMWIARNQSLAKLGANVEDVGIPDALTNTGYKRLAILGSSLMHYSLEKTAGLLGLGTKGLVRVQADAAGRSRPQDIREALVRLTSEGTRVIAIVGIAGTTDSGGLDDLHALAGLAEEYDVHFHVDAAWGGATIFSERHRGLLRGIELADSVTIDGHKQLYLPMGMGILLLKDPSAAKSIEKQAPYIVRQGSPDLGRRSIEGSRPATALLLHAALHLFGRAGFAYLIDHGIALAASLAQLVRASESLELVNDPELNIVNFRYLPRSSRHNPGQREAIVEANRINIEVQERLRDGGSIFLSRTTLMATRYSPEPIVVLRSVLANPLISEDHLRALVSMVVETASRMDPD